jgi:hypothetical protein
MYYIALYFLIGAIVAVWTAINQSRLDRGGAEGDKRPLFDMLGAYLLIALAWPVSVIAFFYTLFAEMVTGGQGGGE